MILVSLSFTDNLLVVNYITRKDDKTPYAVRCLFEQIVPFCLTPTTNVLLNSDGNATILWYQNSVVMTSRWKNIESPLGLWFIIKSLMNLSTWLDIVGSYSGVLTVWWLLGMWCRRLISCVLLARKLPRYPTIDPSIVVSAFVRVCGCSRSFYEEKRTWICHDENRDRLCRQVLIWVVFFLDTTTPST